MVTKQSLLRIMRLTFVAAALLAMTVTGSFAAGSGTISYQGMIKLASGELPADDHYKFNFSLFETESGGSAVWTETYDNEYQLSVIDGVVSVPLGTITPFPQDLFSNYSELWLQIVIDLNKNGELEKEELYAPRVPLTATPYAYHADNAQYLGGYSEAGFVKSSEDLWVLNTGDDMTGALHAQDTVANTSNAPQSSIVSAINLGNGNGLYGSSAGDLGKGVYGYATNTGDVVNYGGYFRTNAIRGRGVYGTADGLEAYGVYGIASGDNGTGVYGDATKSGAKGIEGYNSAGGTAGHFESDANENTTLYSEASDNGNVSNTAGYFKAMGWKGTGIYGEANSTADATNYGGKFQAAGIDGYGVWAKATNTGDVNNTGGYFEALGERGTGVVGVATTITDKRSVGGRFSSFGDTGYGVKGEGYGTEATGGYFFSTGPSGEAVHGVATALGDGTSYGGYFESKTTSGRAVYGLASGQYGQGGYFTSSGLQGKGIYAECTNNGAEKNYGGYFHSKGTEGRGVYANNSGQDGRGVIGEATGSGGVGVEGKGWAGGWDIYANGGGVNYGPFTGAHEVKLAPDFPEKIIPGLIVSATGKAEVRNNDNGDISLSSTLPTIKLADKVNDKAVFGVLVSEYQLFADHWYKATEGERFAQVNALGEGRVWVCSANGDIEAGDYITTSDVPGYGQKQEGDQLCNYTLGKAIETIDWDSIAETIVINGKTYKVYLLAVVYTSG